MNKHTIRTIRKQAQAGFTLIELIVVIVILGILAATALPKFSSVSNDARFAALKAAYGSLQTVSASAHGQYLLNPTITSVTFEGQAVALTNGYPTGGTDFMAAAGLSTADYALTGTGPYTISPASLTAATTTCKFTYTAAAANGQASFGALPSDSSGCDK
jgi:MSHA pilin protein MshA